MAKDLIMPKDQTMKNWPWNQPLVPLIYPLNPAMQKVEIPEKNVLNPQIEKDLEAWLVAMGELNKAREEIKKLALTIHTFGGIQRVMAEVMNMQGDRVNTLSAVDNLDSDLRSEVGAGQGVMNGFGGSKVDATKEANKLINFVDQLQGFIREQEGMGKKAVADPADLKNLQSAINNITGAFKTAWGNPKEMGERVEDWIKESKSHGTSSPELKSIQDGFQTLNQSTSALSTTTNTNLQFVTEQYKQFLGVYQNINQTWLKLTQNEVSNQRTA